jgi:hypothetical protein
MLNVVILSVAFYLFLSRVILLSIIMLNAVILSAEAPSLAPLLFPSIFFFIMEDNQL